jgi:hypothetical protein
MIILIGHTPCCVWDIPTVLLLLLCVGVGCVWALVYVLDWITKHFHETIVRRFPCPPSQRRSP